MRLQPERRVPIRADDERARWLFADVAAAFQAGLGQRAYAEIALIGKSLGTLAMGHLLATNGPGAIRRAVWLTPMLGEASLRDAIERHPVPSLFVIGTADPHYDPAILHRLTEATAGASVVIAGADHGMDIPGDPVASVNELARIVAALTAFLP